MMKKLLTYCLLVIFIFPVFSQNKSDEAIISVLRQTQTIDFKGEKPISPLYLENREGVPAPAYIIVSDSAIYSAPTTSSAKILTGSFLQLFYVCRKFDDGGRKFILLCTLDAAKKNVDKVIGWIQEDNCLTKLDAEKNENGIFKKALIVNKCSDASTRKERLDVASIYDGPGKNFRELQKSGLYNLHYVFKEIKTNETEGFKLIGVSPRLLSITRPSDVIIGWIAENRILEWNTREAIEFAYETKVQRKNDPAKIFEKQEELIEWIKGIHPSTEPLATEQIYSSKDKDRVSPNWPANWMRFPLLNAKPYSIVKGEDIMMCKVGFVRDSISADQSFDSFNRGIQALRQQVRNIEIVIVIDATGSMIRYFKAISDSVKVTFDKVLKEYGKEDKTRPEVKFAVIFFRDYWEKDSENIMKLLPFEKDLQKVIQCIDSEVIMEGDGANPSDPKETTEAVFNGICKGLDELERKFSENSVRMMLVIGDRGNHIRDPQWNNDDVIKRLVKNEVNIYALQVTPSWVEGRNISPAEQIKFDPGSMLFKDQFESIIDGVKKKSTILDGFYFCLGKSNDLSDRIIETCKVAINKSERIQKALKELSTGRDLHFVEQEQGVKISDHLRRMIEKKGLKPEDFTKPRPELETGWVAMTNPRLNLMQIKTVVLMERDELQMLATLLIQMLREPVSRKNVATLWKKALEAEIGEEYGESMPIEKYLQLHMGIQIKENLLKKNIKELSEMTTQELIELQNRLKKKKDVLFNYLEGDKKAVWFNRNDVSYGWISVEDLP